MKRRLVILLLALLFVIGVVIRILHFPFRISAVMRVIPADAVFMSRHVAPATRLTGILESGFVDPVLALANPLGEHLGREWAADAGFTWLANRLGGRYMATAYVEYFGGRPVPAYIVSAWVGGRFTHLARLGFLDHAFPDFRMTRVDNHTRIWRGYFPELPRGFEHVSFGVYEGVAFGVATDDPFGAAHLYGVMRRQVKSRAWDLLEAQAAVVPVGIPDRLRIRDLSGGVVHAGLVFEEPVALTLHLTMPAGEPGGIGDRLPALLGDLIPVIEPAAAVFCGTTVGRGMHMLGRLPLHPVVTALADVLFIHGAGAREDAALVVWIADWEHGARFMRLRAPAVAVAFETVPGVSAGNILDATLARMQAGWGLAWGHAPYGQHGVYALIPPTGNGYGRLPPAERAGFAIWNGYAILHSSADALDRLLTSQAGHTAVVPQRLPEGAGWYIRGDMRAMAEVLRMGGAGYFLWQAMEGRVRDGQLETMLRQVADVMAGYALIEIALHERTGGELVGVVKLEQSDPEQ